MQNAILMGGSGYVGIHLAERWLKSDPNIRITSLSRGGKPERLSSFMATCERMQWLKVDVFNIDSYLSLLPERADVIVELIGTATANTDAEFDHLNTDTVKIMVELMRRRSIANGCYISGMIGMPGKSKPFIRSKRAGEAIAQSSGLDIAIIRPSLVYGDRPGVALMVGMVKVMGLFNKDLKPITVDVLADKIIQSVSK